MPSNKSSKRDQSPEMPDLEPLEPKKINDTAAAAASADKKSGTDDATRKSSGGGDTDVKLNDLAQPSSSTMQRLNALKNNQLKYLQAQTKYFEEFHALQSKYARVYGDIFDRRRQIVSGECEPGTDECKWPPVDVNGSDNASNGHDAKKEENGDSKQENGEATSNEKSGSKSNGEKRPKNENNKKASDLRRANNALDEKGVPNFWLEVLQSSRTMEALIFEHDEPVLAYLVDIRVRVEPDKPAASYTLEFEFAEDNPYFRNRVLTKTFEFRNEINAKAPFKYHGPDLVRTVGCHIDWKPRKNVTVKVIKKKLKSRNRKAPPKIITKEEKQHSFFRFFESHACITNEEAKKKESGSAKGDKKEDPSSSSAKKQQQQKPASGVASSNKNRQHSGGGSSNHDDEEDDDGEEDDEVDMPEDDAEFGRKLTDTFLMMHDYSIAERLRNKIIPKAVLYMTGEVAHSDDDEDDHDDDDDDDDDEYDDDDDDYYVDDDDDDDEDYSDDDESDHDDKKGKVYSEWTREMSERVYRPMGGRAINPAECKQS